MIWLIILLLGWLGFLAWEDPDVKKSENFKRTVEFVAGAMAGLGGSQVLAKFAVSGPGQGWMVLSGFAEAAAWFCLVMAVHGFLKGRGTPS